MLTSKGFTNDKTLSSVFDAVMVKGKTAEEIKQIWQQYFAAKDAVLPKEKFDLIRNGAQSCSGFLCALPLSSVGQSPGTYKYPDRSGSCSQRFDFISLP